MSNPSLPFTAPFSAGEGRTTVDLPPGACDCHIHVYDQRFPTVPSPTLKPADATIQDYRRVQHRIGTQRAVLVTPSTYGTDNRPMLQGLNSFGPDARGIAVIDESFDDAQLRALHEAGVRGIRLNLSLGASNDARQLQPLAERISPLGWHVQLLAPPDLLATLREPLLRLPVPIVFDHFGRITPSMAGRHAAHRLIRDLLEQGRAWVKLSGCYIVTQAGPPLYPDVAELADDYLRLAPGKVLWGSDWPHASATAGHQALPDDASQMDLLAS